MVYKIIVNYVYTGATVGHRRKSGGVGSRKSIAQDQEDWIVVEGMHEAIVSKDEFELAQAVIRGRREESQKESALLSPQRSLCAAATANAPLPGESSEMRADISISVPTQRMTAIRIARLVKDTARHGLRTLLTKAIGQMLTLVEKRAVKEHEISKRRKSAITECADTIRDLQKQSEQLKAVKLRLYEKYTSGSITKAEYLKRKAETDAKMSENEEAIRQGHERMQELDSEHPCSDERLDAVLGEYQKGEGLTYELAHALISAIYVHGHDSIEIVWMFKDIFEDAEI